MKTETANGKLLNSMSGKSMVHQAMAAGSISKSLVIEYFRFELPLYHPEEKFSNAHLSTESFDSSMNNNSLLL